MKIEIIEEVFLFLFINYWYFQRCSYLIIIFSTISLGKKMNIVGAM